MATHVVSGSQALCAVGCLRAGAPVPGAVAKADESAAVATELDAPVAAIVPPGFASGQRSIRASSQGCLRAPRSRTRAVSCVRADGRNVAVAMNGLRLESPASVLLAAHLHLELGQDVLNTGAVAPSRQHGANEERPAFVMSPERDHSRPR